MVQTLVYVETSIIRILILKHLKRFINKKKNLKQIQIITTKRRYQHNILRDIHMSSFDTFRSL